MVSTSGLSIGILSGVTASGKTSLGLELARELAKRGVRLEIINADSLIVSEIKNKEAIMESIRTFLGKGK